MGEASGKFSKKVASIYSYNMEGLRVLDLGCGDGKNSIYLRNMGASVIGIDCSGVAISKCISHYPDSAWICGEIRLVHFEDRYFDVIISTGAIHCFNEMNEISNFLKNMIRMTKVGGYNIISSFNNGSHDFSGHPNDFKVILPEHDFILQQYAGNDILFESNQVQSDVHPDIGVKHHHSISRVLVRIC